MTARALVAAAWLVALGCSLDDVDLATKSVCPCAPEYECVQGVCRPLGQATDVLAPNGPAANGTDADVTPPAPPDGGDEPVAAPDAAPPSAMPDAAVDAGPVCPEPPLDPGPCPPECNGGCTAGICSIVCDSFQDCMLGVTRCPMGWPCRVECSGQLACAVPGQIICADGPCDIRCTGTGACGAALVTCGTGPCAIACPTSIVPPTIQCGNSCSCAGVCQAIPPG